MEDDWTALGLHKRHLRNSHPTGLRDALRAKTRYVHTLKYPPAPSICDPSTFSYLLIPCLNLESIDLAIISTSRSLHI